MNRKRSASRGAILLEVVLALGVLTVAAGFIASGMSASTSTAERMRHQTHALDLAVTILSRVQMERLQAVPHERQHFRSPFQDYSWELKVEPAGHGPRSYRMARVEVIVRHEKSATVRRLTQLLSVREISDRNPEPHHRDEERLRRIREIFAVEEEKDGNGNDDDQP